DTAEDCRSTLEEAGLTPTVELPGEPVWVKGDPTRLAQVLGNLCQNAAKFTDRGGQVRVRLSVEDRNDFTAETWRHGDRSEEDEHRWALLTVRDTGIGIEPEMLPRVFEAFAQADRSLDRSRGWLVLGLALVKGLVELHHGEVRADSAG